MEPSLPRVPGAPSPRPRAAQTPRARADSESYSAPASAGHLSERHPCDLSPKDGTHGVASLPRVATTRRPADSRGPSPTATARHLQPGTLPVCKEGRGGASRPTGGPRALRLGSRGPLGGRGGHLGLGPGSTRTAFRTDLGSCWGAKEQFYFLSLSVLSNFQRKARVWLETKWAADLGVCGQLGSHASYAKQPLVPPSNLRGEGLYVVCSWMPRAWHTISA